MAAPRHGGGTVTIYEVAAAARVSITTVSRVLNRPDQVNAGTRQKVMTEVDRLNFVPKLAAVTQARKGVGRIGVLAPFASYSSYLRRLVGILTNFEAEPIDVVVFNHESVAHTESPILQNLPTTGRLDALIIMGVPISDEMADRLKRRKLATVLVDTVHPAFSSVTVDDELGGYLVGRHLCDRGHQDVAFLSEGQRSTAYTSSGALRVQGLSRALSESGFPQGVHHVIASNDVAGGRAALDDVLATGAKAVFGHHDDLAVGLLGEARRRHLSVPGELAVVGYDGGELAEALSLTTMRQPLEETGRIATQLLRSALDSPTSTVAHVNLTPELVIGETS